MCRVRDGIASSLTERRESMARVVLLSFVDNDAAEHFIEGALAAQDENTPTDQLATEIMATGAIVVACSTIEAMVARPTAACKCKIVGKSRGSSRGKFSALTENWYKSERFGWLIHKRCKRPNYWAVARFIENMIVGVGCNDPLPERKERIKEEEEVCSLPETMNDSAQAVSKSGLPESSGKTQTEISSVQTVDAVASATTDT